MRWMSRRCPRFPLQMYAVPRLRPVRQVRSCWTAPGPYFHSRQRANGIFNTLFSFFLINVLIYNSLDLQPTCLPALRNLLIAGGGHEMPHWRRRHHGRSGHWNPHHHGRWNAWCPSGINVEVDPPCGSGSENTKEEKEKPSSCPFKSNMEHAREQAKQAAQAFQANGPEFLQNIGTTLAAMLEQFGK